jgi:hypothetical protein
LLGQNGQQLICSQRPTFDLEAQPDQGDARAVVLVADLVTARELPLGHHDLLHDDSNIRGKPRAKDLP